MENKKGLILGLIVVVLSLVGGITFAYYRWVSEENINISVQVEGSTVTYVGGDNISGTLIPTATKEEGIKKDVTVVANAEGSTMSLFLELTMMHDDLKEKSFEWEVYYNDTTLVKKGNFGVYNASSNQSGTTYATSGVTTITLFENRSVNTTTDKYTLYLWFNGKDYTNPNKMQNKTVSFNLYATGDNATLAG